MTSSAPSLSEGGSLRLAILGAGSVGRLLGRRAVERGLQVVAVASRSEESAWRLASELGVDQAFDDVSRIPATANLILVCVPDSEVRNVVKDLRALDREWDATVVAHTSGALPASILSPIEERGAVVLSFHPLQAITSVSSPAVLDDAYAGVEGSTRGVAAGEELAAALGMKSVVIPPTAKPRYHLAAVLASNLLVAQIGMAEEVLRSVGFLSPGALELLGPLVQGTLENVQTSGVEQALTGPVVRGDLETLEAHVEALESDFPHLVPAYVALSNEALRLAVKSGRLDAERAKEMSEFLGRMV